MYIVGLSCYFHDASACVIRDGDIIAAAQEERFSRIKHDPKFPEKALTYCLQESKITLKEVDQIVFYDRLDQKRYRILDTYTSFAPLGKTMLWNAIRKWCGPSNPENDLYHSINTLSKKDGKIFYPHEIEFVDHHFSHAASAFFPSPYMESAILTIDGVGEYATTSYGQGKDNHVTLERQINFPNSLGLLYSAFTAYLGFRVNSGEYKVMGLAPYGSPTFQDRITEHIISWNPDGTYRLNSEYFNFFATEQITSSKFHKLFGGPPRKRESKITPKECDIAASIQAVTEEAILRLATYVREATNQKNLCLAGGVALNCVANSKLLRKKTFDHIWVQPAAGDAGGALGAALGFYYHYQKNERKISMNPYDSMKGCALGPSFSNEEIEIFLRKQGYPFERLSDRELFSKVSDLLVHEKVIGWFSGRMEFGPRALGHRSIIADPRSKKMQSLLNLKIKYRESFRPFAPSVLAERAGDYFELRTDSPYMLFVAQVASKHRIPVTEEAQKAQGIDAVKLQRSTIPAVTHVDYSARIQTVHKDTNSRYYHLIKTFEEKTDCAVLINTSFNVRGEPIVCTIQDAYRCFMRTEMDVFVLENYLLRKENQPVLFEDET